MDGYIGVLHRGFEERWAKDRPGQRNFHCLAMNIANIDVLREEQYITYVDPHSLHSFCSAIVTLLETMPHDVQDLRKVLGGEQLAGTSAEKFMHFDRDDKLKQLQQFISVTQVR
jgi:hypothetical protein